MRQRGKRLVALGLLIWPFAAAFCPTVPLWCHSAGGAGQQEQEH
ncbi:hypothetical protein [Amycolatopsis japonica]